MNKNLTEMVFILDRSGSMSGLEKDTVGGYNSLLEKQRKEEGEAMVTTVLFDDRYEIIHSGADIKKVENITEKEYYARGMTALYDAIGKTVNMVGERHKMLPSSLVPSKTVVVIITDGFENSSTEYSLRHVKSIIERQKEKFGWEFIFLGANIDAESTAEGMGIERERAVTYQANSKGTQNVYCAMANTVSDVRCHRPISSKRMRAEINKNV